MINRRGLSLSIAIILLVGLSASESQATNGYFSHGDGAMYKALAGAGVALFNLNRDSTVTRAPSGFPGTFGLAPGTVAKRKFALRDPRSRRQLDDRRR